MCRPASLQQTARTFVQPCEIVTMQIHGGIDDSQNNYSRIFGLVPRWYSKVKRKIAVIVNRSDGAHNADLSSRSLSGTPITKKIRGSIHPEAAGFCWARDAMSHCVNCTTRIHFSQAIQPFHESPATCLSTSFSAAKTQIKEYQQTSTLEVVTVARGTAKCHIELNKV